jgi:predicted transcriptional regulator
MRSTQENLLLLRSRGYSQMRIAEELGISQPMVSRWENGEVPNAADIALRLDRLASAVDQAPNEAA